MKSNPCVRTLALAGLAGACLLAAPVAAHEPHSSSHAGWTNGYSTSDDGGAFKWSVFDPRTGSSASDLDDFNDFRNQFRSETRPLFWFSLDGARYVVRDAELVARAQESVAPMRELSERQGRLGSKQGALGRQQSELGRRQSQLGARQAAMSARLSRVALAESRDRDRSLTRERRDIEAEINALSSEQAQLGALQGSLGRAQGELGREQGELGREQARLAARASVELRKLADEAIRLGKVERLKVRRSI